ncbi:P-loop NTPase family protein [Cellulomonas alba]|uniref:Toxin n=1 Tax=Cellulomonas alba TaxID=3053467 RepID=A0ABT7SII3_9CELL|nr:toxin [Cellulomonas alba]MDM7855975.1 toxin [Cellulomonas alba]
MPADPPRRIRVVGNTGSGKTTLARAAADRLGVLHVELDEVFWSEGWTKRDRDEARAILRERLSTAGAAGWVADGNWNRDRQGMLDDADLVVWLDYPRRLVMRRVLVRTLRRGVTRQELWHGNRERLRNLLRRDPDQNVVLWSWTQHPHYRETYAALAASDPRVVRLAGPREADAWLAGLRRVAG